MRSILCVLALAAAASASTVPSTELVAEDLDPRFFNTNFSQYTISLESLVGSALALLALLFLLGALAAIAAVFLGGGGDQYTGYSGVSSYSSSGGSSYADYARSLQTENLLDAVRTIDWIGLAEELYGHKEEITSRACQQQLVCQLRRSAPGWGETARAASGAIDYISYMKLLRLPEDVLQLLDQYERAASVGRSGYATCEEQFPCGVDLRSLVDKISGHQPDSTSA